jgi:hypothetical protein
MIAGAKLGHSAPRERAFCGGVKVGHPPDLDFVSYCLDGMVHGTPEGCSRWRYTGVYVVRFVLRAGVSER